MGGQGGTALADVVEQRVIVEVRVEEVQCSREESDVHAHVSSVLAERGLSLGRIFPFDERALKSRDLLPPRRELRAHVSQGLCAQDGYQISSLGGITERRLRCDARFSTSWPVSAEWSW